MTRRKNRKRPVSPGVTLGRDLRQAELSATTYQSGGKNYLDPHVAAREIREGDNKLARFFQDADKVAQWSAPVRPIK